MRMCHPQVEDDTARNHYDTAHTAQNHYDTVFVDDAQKRYELLWFVDMILASWRCCPQLFHPHLEDDTDHVEDEHPIHPLQRMRLTRPHQLPNIINHQT
jgi:hypothetical protein